MTNSQTITDEIEKAKQKLTEAREQLKQNQYVIDENDVDDTLDAEKQKLMVEELDKSLNDALLKLVIKEDENETS